MKATSMHAASESNLERCPQTQRSFAILTPVVVGLFVWQRFDRAVMTIFRLKFITLNCLIGFAMPTLVGVCVAQNASDSVQEDRELASSIVIARPVLDEGDATKFLTGSRLEKANVRAKSVTWQSSDLRTRLHQISQTQSIGIFLDRRSNGQRSEDLVIQNATTEQMLWQLAKTHDASVARVGNVYYFGPEKYAAALDQQMQLLIQETAKNRKAYRVDWRKSKSLKTGPVTIPRDLLLSLSKEHQFEFTNLDEIHHDVWIGFELPPMSLTELIQWLVVGFGKTIQRSEDGSKVTLVDFPIADNIERALYFPSSAKNLDYDSLVGQWQSEHSSLGIERKGKKLTLRGAALAILEVESKMVALQEATGGSADDVAVGVYSVTVTASRLGILQEIAKQNGLKLSYLAEHKETLEQRVSIDVKNVTVETLLVEVFQASPLRGRVEDKILQISDR